MDLPQSTGLAGETDAGANTSDRPLTVSDLCASLGIPYTGLLVACNFCRRTLTSVELVFFDHAECKLLWKNDCPLAICYLCLKMLAKFEYLLFYKNTTDVVKAEQMLRKPITEFKIRCLLCLRRFQPDEVEQLRRANCTIFVVGYRLRAKCYLCALGFI